MKKNTTKASIKNKRKAKKMAKMLEKRKKEVYETSELEDMGFSYSDFILRSFKAKRNEFLEEIAQKIDTTDNTKIQNYIDRKDAQYAYGQRKEKYEKVVNKILQDER